MIQVMEKLIKEHTLGESSSLWYHFVVGRVKSFIEATKHSQDAELIFAMTIK